jgi:hypothetical protein
MASPLCIAPPLLRRASPSPSSSPIPDWSEIEQDIGERVRFASERALAPTRTGDPTPESELSERASPLSQVVSPLSFLGGALKIDVKAAPTIDVHAAPLTLIPSGLRHADRMYACEITCIDEDVPEPTDQENQHAIAAVGARWRAKRIDPDARLIPRKRRQAAVSQPSPVQKPEQQAAAQSGSSDDEVDWEAQDIANDPDFKALALAARASSENWLVEDEGESSDDDVGF